MILDQQDLIVLSVGFFFFGEAFLQFVVEGIGLKKVVKYDIRKDI